MIVTTATPNQALLLWCTSWLICYSGIDAFQKELPDLSIASFCVFITSILYWKNPRKNWIRTLDIVTVSLSILYHLRRSLVLLSFKNKYPFFLLGTVLLYPTSWYFYKSKKYWLSFYLHALMHICGNLSNLYLYQEIYQRQFVTSSNSISTFRHFEPTKSILYIESKK